VGAIVMACLQKDPARRPQSMRVIREWIQSGEEVAVEPEKVSLTSARETQRLDPTPLLATRKAATTGSGEEPAGQDEDVRLPQAQKPQPVFKEAAGIGQKSAVVVPQSKVGNRKKWVTIVSSVLILLLILFVAKAVRKNTADKVAAEKRAAVVAKTDFEKAVAEKTAAEKTAAEKTAAEKTAAEKTAAEKTAAEKAAAEKAAAAQSAAQSRAAAVKIAEKGLVAYYPFNGNGKDESGKGRHGTIKSPIRGYVTGKLGSGIAMTPSSSIALPFGHFQECTVSMWVKPDSIGKRNALLNAHGFRRSENWIHLDMHEQGYPEAGVCTGAHDWTYSTISRQVQMPLKQWSHVAFSWGQPGLHLYLNGQLIGIGKRKRWSGPNPIYPKQLPGPPAAPVRLGKSVMEWRLGDLFSSVGAGMNGVMDEVRIHDRVLTETEIKALYDLEKSGTQRAPLRQPVTPQPRQ
jgi:hypothetical protein